MNPVMLLTFPSRFINFSFDLASDVGAMSFAKCDIKEMYRDEKVTREQSHLNNLLTFISFISIPCFTCLYLFASTSIRVTG